MDDIRYEIEVWNKSGVKLGDIRHLCRNLTWSKQRNEAEEVSFDMDMAEYERYLDRIGVQNPREFIDVLSTDIRIKRDGRYILGANITMIDMQTSNPSVSMSVKASGYLNFFKTAYADIAYTNTPQGDIAWGVLEAYQSKNGADYGIASGGDFGSNEIKRDRNFIRKNIKDFLQQLSNVIGGLDFEFTADKKFKTYKAIGSHRPDIKLIYPDNIDSFSVSRDGSMVSNYIHALGSGNGDDAIQTSVEDNNSLDNYYRHETVKTFNSVTQLSTLQENANGILEITKDVMELPKLTIHDGILDLNDVGIGDTVYVELTGYKSISHIAGDYRIEKIEVSVDDNDAETIQITFDGINVDEIIQQQGERE